MLKKPFLSERKGSEIKVTTKEIVHKLKKTIKQKLSSFIIHPCVASNHYEATNLHADHKRGYCIFFK